MWWSTSRRTPFWDNNVESSFRLPASADLSQPCIFHNEHSSVPLPGSPSPPNVTLYQIVFEKMRVSEDQCSPALTHVHHMHYSWASHALATGITHADYAYTHAGHGYHTHCSWALHALLTGITRTDHGHHTCWPLASHVLLMGITHTGHGHHMRWPQVSHSLATGITHAGHKHHTRWSRASHAPAMGISPYPPLAPYMWLQFCPLFWYFLSIAQTPTLYPSSLSLVLSASLLYAGNWEKMAKSGNLGGTRLFAIVIYFFSVCSTQKVEFRPLCSLTTWLPQDCSPAGVCLVQLL